MADNFGKEDQWNDFSRDELLSVRDSILYLARRTGSYPSAEGISTPANTEGSTGQTSGKSGT